MWNRSGYIGKGGMGKRVGVVEGEEQDVERVFVSCEGAGGGG